MTLAQEITQFPALVALKDHGAIAAALSVNRKRPISTEMGKGTILGVLGFAAGNAFLDVIDNAPDYRHVKSIVAAGKFDVSLAESKAGIQAMVPAVLTQPQADSLMALGYQPETITALQVAMALEGN